MLSSTLLRLFQSLEECPDYLYDVGFQVDLTEQPNVILPKLRDGSYMVNYSSQTGFSTTDGSLLGGSALGETSGAKKARISQRLISKELKMLLAGTDFIPSIPISTLTTVPPLAASSDKGDQSMAQPHSSRVLPRQEVFCTWRPVFAGC